MASHPKIASLPISLGLHDQPDLAELLEAERAPAAASTFRAMRQKLADLRAMRMSVGDEIDFHRTSKIAAEARERQLKLARGSGGPDLSDDDLQVREARRSIERHAGEMKRLGDLNEVRDHVSANLAKLVNRCEDTVRGKPRNTRIVAVQPPEVSTVIRKGENSTRALERLRHRLRELDADEHRVRSAPYPSSHAKARVREMLEQRAQAPDLSALVEHDAEIRWPMLHVEHNLIAVGQGHTPVVGRSSGEVPDALAILSWFDRPRLIAMLNAEIDALSDDGEALTHEARQVKLAEIEADRIAIEREEAALIASMQREGLAIEHRVDASPLAVLSIALETVAAA